MFFVALAMTSVCEPLGYGIIRQQTCFCRKQRELRKGELMDKSGEKENLHAGQAHNHAGHNQEHQHILADGTVLRHVHTHTQTKAVLNRMSRIIGHMESIRKMVETGRDCSEVLVQLAAVHSALQGVSRVILKDHIEHCLVDAVKSDDQKMLDDLKMAIDRFMK